MNVLVYEAVGLMLMVYAGIGLVIMGGKRWNWARAYRREVRAKVLGRLR